MTNMAMKDGSSEASSVSPVVQSLVNFIEVFYRIFKIGNYYPIGHVVLDQAAFNFLQQLRETFHALHTVTIEVDSHRLLVEKTALPEDTPSAQELGGMLANLGIKSIEMQRDMPHKHVLQFVRALLAWRGHLESASSFISYDISGLPSTVRITQLEYLVDENSIVPEGKEGGNNIPLEELCAALGSRGLDDRQLLQCREFLAKLSVPEDGEKPTVPGLPHATWQDVQNLLYRVVTRDHRQDEHISAMVAQNDVSALASIFGRLERSVTDSKGKTAINLLLRHLTGSGTSRPGPVREVAKVEVPHRQGVAKPTVTAGQITQFVDDNKMPIAALEKITSADQSEIISVILQMLGSTENRKSIDSCERMLAAFVNGLMTAEERMVLIGGMRNFAEGEDEDRFRGVLKLVLTSCRETQSLLSFTFLKEMWSKMPYNLHGAVWPFVVNELLIVGMGESKERFYEVTEIASHMQLGAMRCLRSQLEELDAFREQKVAPVVFCPAWIRSYRLFAFLLETSLAGIIAEKVVAELQNAPPEQFIAVIAPILQISVPDHLQFLHSYLAEVRHDSPPLALKMAAGQIILQFLENITEEQKKLPWLAKTIDAMAGLQVRGTKEILDRIANERRMGLLPAWPKQCRQAATTALDKIKSRQLSRLL
ncbi:MAG: hypothetical protein ACD_75C02437G0002 [uncultured bacterium]|nr:MAG: hypothetical protein ACD_75C02437G0002 [uncultured bacterium]